MNASQTIRDAVARVEDLRLRTKSSIPLQKAITAVKSFQSRRFSGTYSDLLNTREYGAAANFFLVELYSEKDYSLRDAQFARIAGALQRLFPQQVVATAVALAELHVLTEEMDHEMALAWIRRLDMAADPERQYLAAWRDTGRQDARTLQLELVLKIGSELERLTRTSGLRMMLKMMRRPAKAMGLEALQLFLEAGFDTFAAMSGKEAHATKFLITIRNRESKLLEKLYDDDASLARCELSQHMIKANQK